MYGLGMRPGRASLPRLQHPASSTQSEHLRGGRTRRPAEARPHPFPLATLLQQPDRVRSQNTLKTWAAKPLQRSCTRAERLGIRDSGKKERPLGCRALTLCGCQL